MWDAYSNTAGRARKRPGPLAVSLLLHGAAFYALMNAPQIQLPEPAKSEYKQAIEGKETKLVWYEFKKELPPVTPLEAKAERKPPRATVAAPQQIVASRKDAPKRTQMVWTPAPELHEPPPVELPNILAIRLPEITRAFVAPPDIVRPPAPNIELPADAPQLQAKPLDPVKVADIPKVTKRFVAPPTQVPVKVKEVVAPSDAPLLEARASDPAALNYSFKTPPRPFTAPPAKPAPTIGKPVAVETPPELLA